MGVLDRKNVTPDGTVGNIWLIYCRHRLMCSIFLFKGINVGIVRSIVGISVWDGVGVGGGGDQSSLFALSDL